MRLTTAASRLLLLVASVPSGSDAFQCRGSGSAFNGNGIGDRIYGGKVRVAAPLLYPDGSGDDDESVLRGKGRPEPPPYRRPKSALELWGSAGDDDASPLPPPYRRPKSALELVSSSAEDEEALLAEAQREAKEAGIMLAEAEAEAAKWEKELKDMEEAEARAKEADKGEENAQGDGTDALADMANAYQAALDAANDNVDLLSKQIAALESELATATATTETSDEERDKIAAEYADLNNSFKQLQSEKGGKGGQIGGDPQSPEDEKIAEGYRNKIQELEGRLEGAGRSLDEAREEADGWREDRERVQSEMAEMIAQAAADREGLVERLELQVAEADTAAQGAELRAKEGADAEMGRLSSEFESRASDGRKMVSALRQVLRRTRQEKSNLEAKSGTERNEAVEDVRRKMDTEMAKLKDVLKTVEVEMGQKDLVMKEAVDGRAQREGLLEETRELQESLKLEKSNSAELAAGYEERLSKYAENEEAMQQETNDLDGAIKTLQSKRDATEKEVAALRLQLEALEGKAEAARASTEASEDKLRKDLDLATSSFREEKSTMGTDAAEAQQKIVSLEEELGAKARLASATENALEETRTNLKNISKKYDGETEAVRALREESEGLRGELAEAESRRRDAASRGEQDDDAASAAAAAAEKQVQTLQSQTDALAAQLEEASKKLAATERRLEEYENRIQSMSEKLLQSSGEVQGREEELAALRAELVAAREGAEEAVAEQSERADGLQAELEGTKGKLGDLLAKANAEVARRGEALERKEGALEGLRREHEGLRREAEAAGAASREESAARAEELVRTEAGLESEREGSASAVGALEGRVEELKGETAAARADARKTIAARDDERKRLEGVIAAAKGEVERERGSRDEALRGKAEAEESLRKAVERLEADVAAARKDAGRASQEKEREVAGLVDKNKKQHADAEGARARHTKDAKEKVDAILKLEGRVFELTAGVQREIDLRRDVLKGKEGMESKLREKLDDMVAQASAFRADAQEKFGAQAEELKRMEGNSRTDKSQMDRMRSDAAAAQSDAQKAIDAHNGSIESTERVVADLKANIGNERKLRDEALLAKSELEAALRQKLDELARTREKSRVLALEKTQQADRMRARIESSEGVAGKGAEENRRLQSELERVAKERNASLNKADEEIKRRESALSELQTENERLESGRIQSQRVAESKGDEIAALVEKVSSLTANVEREIKLRQDVLSGKEGVESMLQKKLDGMAKEMNAVRADAQQKLNAQAEELKRMEGGLRSTGKDKDALGAQIARLKKDMSVAQGNAQGAVDSRNAEIRKAERVVAALRADIDRERGLRNEAVAGKSELEAALREKVDRLTRGAAAAESAAARAREESGARAAAIEALRGDVGRERAAGERTRRELGARVSELEAESEEGEARSRSALGQRDALLSAMRADLNEATKLRDQAGAERDAVERDLTARNFELRNKMSASKINADKSVKSKTDEAARMNQIASQLQARMVEDTKLHDAELSKMESSLLSKSEQVDRLSKEAQSRKRALDGKTSTQSQLQSEVERLRSAIENEGQLRAKALDEKASMESKMQSELESLRTGIQTSRSNAETAVGKLKEELTRTVAEAERAREQAQEEARAKTAAEAETKMIEDTKLHDAELAEMEASLLSKTEQVDQLSKEAQSREKALVEKSSTQTKLQSEIERLQSAIENEARLRAKALDEKASMESNMQSELEALRADIKTSRSNAETAVGELKDELVRTTVEAERAREQAQDEARAKTAAEAEAKMVAKTKMHGAELAEVEASLLSKTEQVDQLSKEAQSRERALVDKSSMQSKLQSEVERLQSAIENEARLRAKALDEKASMESNMQSELEALRADIRTSRSNAETAVGKLKDELARTAAEAERARAQAQSQYESRAKAAAEAQAQYESRAKAAAVQQEEILRARQHAEELGRQQKETEQQAEQQRAAAAEARMRAKQQAEEDARAEAAAAAWAEEQRANRRAEAEAKAAAAEALAKQQAEDEMSAKAAAEALAASQHEKIQRARQQAAEDEAKAAAAEAEALAAKQKVREQERPKPKGFGKPAMKKAAQTTATTATHPPRDVRSMEDIVVEEAGRAQNAGVARMKKQEAFQRALLSARIAKPVAEKLSMEKEESKLVAEVAAAALLGNKKKNPLRQLITPEGGGGTFPKRRTVHPSQTAADRAAVGGSGEASRKKNPLTDLLMAGKDAPPSSRGVRTSSSSFRERKSAAPPSSQTTAPRQGAPAPNRDPAKTITATPGGKSPLTSLIMEREAAVFPARKAPSAPSRKAAAPPSSQTTAPRQGAPAPNRDPAKTITATPGGKSPLTSLIMKREAAAFPARKAPSAPSSQATPGPPLATAADRKKLSLTDLLSSRTKPIRSNKHRKVVESSQQQSPPPQPLLPPQTPQEETVNATPKQQEPEPVAAAAIAKKKWSLKDLIPSTGKPLGSYGNRKTATKLGGMASPEFAAESKEDRQRATKDSVITLAAATNTPPNSNTRKKKETIPHASSSTAPLVPPISNLAAILQNHNPSERLPRDGLNRERTSMTKLGGIANNPQTDADAYADADTGDVEEPTTEPPQPVVVVETPHNDETKNQSDRISAGWTADDVHDEKHVADRGATGTNGGAAGMKKREAFQRVLLSARIANDANAKLLGVVLQISPPTVATGTEETLQNFSSLGQIIQGQMKQPTLSQQKAFANRNRRTSLFRDKTGSHLSGMASPEFAAKSKEDRQRAMKESVITSATAAATNAAPNSDTRKKKETISPASSSTAPLAPPISNLAAIIRNHNPGERLPRDGLNRQRTSMTKLGGMANNPSAIADADADTDDMAEPTTEPTQPVVAAKIPLTNETKKQSNIATDWMANDVHDEKHVADRGATGTNVGTAGMKKREAFQRALLSARIANDAKAKLFGVVLRQSTPAAATGTEETLQNLSGLGQITQGPTKQTTLSQQKAFANRNRRTSLFPEKTESHLSRLLQK